MRLLIAVDGPAGSGKSTVARTVAERLGLGYIDTGAMYRALALKAIRLGVLEDDDAVAALLDETQIASEGPVVTLDGQDVSTLIRSPEVSAAASIVARHVEVRKWMVAKQRASAEGHPNGAVVEGRDIGTVVLPTAHVKVYLDADPLERARRRAAENGEESEGSVRATMEAVEARDKRDKERKNNPLVAADDAMIIDTTKMSVADVVNTIVAAADASRT